MGVRLFGMPRDREIGDQIPHGKASIARTDDIKASTAFLAASRFQSTRKSWRQCGGEYCRHYKNVEMASPTSLSQIAGAAAHAIQGIRQDR
jgi:hypothetical protein